MIWLCLALLVSPVDGPVACRTPTALVDTALARMGGAERLRGVHRARFEIMTQWFRTAFDGRPLPDIIGYEQDWDLRDYDLGAWRNTRRFLPAPADQDLIDVVVDSVASRRQAGIWRPLNGAYLSERRELFAFAPERLLLAARAAADLRALPDTVVNGAPLGRVAATVDGFPSELMFRRGDGFLAAVRYRAAQPWDAGLAAWDIMDVVIEYGRWRAVPGGITYPTQLDVRRAGVPYKRITYLTTRLDAPATPDSFAVTDALRDEFLATSRHAMFDVPFDSARVVEQSWVDFRTFGAPAGAVRIGGAWVLLESGVAPLTAERALDWLAHATPSSPVARAIVTAPMTWTAGGTGRLLERGVPVLAAPGTASFAGRVAEHQRAGGRSMAAVGSGRWIAIGSDSLRIEPIDLPDAPGSLMIYSPSLHWLYSAGAASPLQRDLILARAHDLGWTVETLGSIRAIRAPVPAEPAS